jgi:hypothetical protein
MRLKQKDRATWAGHRLLTAALVTAAAVGVALGPAGGTVSALEGATLTSSTVYRIDTDSPSVIVESTYELTNVTPNQDTGSGGFRFFFFTDLSVPVNPGASDISVDVDGRGVSVEFIEDEEGFTFIEVPLGRQLRFRQTATIIVRSQLNGAAPRSEESFDRANAAYFAFPVFAFGDEGATSVSIEVPFELISEYVGSDLLRRSENGLHIYEATEIETPSEFNVLFTARNDAALGSVHVSAGDPTFVVHGWPGDEEWIDFATEQITQGVPILEELIGRDWLPKIETDVFEASTLYLRGYGGTYDPAANVIEVGENLDRHTLLHELTHAWINDRVLTERWIGEGLAEEISARAAVLLGDELLEPRTVAEVRGDGLEVEIVDLNTWDSLDSGLDDPIETYGYIASFDVMRDLWDEVGTAQMTALLQAIIDHQRAYPGEDGPELNPSTRVGWMEFLDLAEQTGGSETLIDNYRAQVVTPEQRERLDERAEALVDFNKLVARSGSWAPPRDIRSLMAGWHFGSARDFIIEANRALDARDKLTEALALLRLVPTARIEDTYQNDHRGIADLLDSTAEAARELIATRSELSTTLGAIDLEVPTLTQDQYEADPIGMVTEQRSLLTDAEELASQLENLRSRLADNELSVPELAASAFVDDHGAAIATVLDQIDATEALTEALRLREEADSFVERVGTVRTDVDEQLDAVAELLAAGDTDGVRLAVAAATDDIDELRSTGLNRIITGASIIVGLLVLLLIVGRLRRRRRSRHEIQTESDSPLLVASPADQTDDGIATLEPANSPADSLLPPAAQTPHAPTAGRPPVGEVDGLP